MKTEASLHEKLETLEIYHVEDGWATVFSKGSETIYEDVTLDHCPCRDFERRNGGTYDLDGARVCFITLPRCDRTQTEQV